MSLTALAFVVATSSAVGAGLPAREFTVERMRGECCTRGRAGPPLLAQGAQERRAPPLPSPSQEWRVEGVLAMGATSPASNVETTVAPFLGVRAGTLAPAREAASVGFDGALYLGQVKDGTPEVSTTRTIAFVEGRGLFAPMRVTSTFSALVPYGFLGAALGGGVVEVRAFEDGRIRPLFTWATRVGLGAELQVHALTTRLELGAGLRDLRAELTSALSLGIAF